MEDEEGDSDEAEKREEAAKRDNIEPVCLTCVAVRGPHSVLLFVPGNERMQLITHSNLLCSVLHLGRKRKGYLLVSSANRVHISKQ